MEYNATVLDKQVVADGLIIIRVAPDDTPYSFEPGQYTVLGLLGREARVKESDPEEPPPDPDKMIKRAYSLASGSTEKELEFYIALVRSGALTPRILALREGDRVWVSSKPTGLFTLDSVPSDQGIVLVATGTGLAPYMSMVRTHLTDECGRQRRWGVFHGAWKPWDLGYRSELEAWNRDCDNFVYLPTVDSPEGDRTWKGSIGRVHTFLEKEKFRGVFGEELDPERQHFFLCGNPGMVEAASAYLQSVGFSEWHKRKNPEGTIHLERYW